MQLLVHYEHKYGGKLLQQSIRVLMGETHNVISQKRISRALKLVPILSNKARLIDLVGHCNQVLGHATYLGYKCYLAKNKRTGKDVCMHICSNKFYF